MYEIQIRWTAFPLHPDTPEEGLTLEALFAGRNFDIPKMKSRLKTAAKDFGVDIGDRQRTYNSRLAQELGKWAESKSKGDEFHLAAFKAYFVNEQNIAKIPILVDIAKSVNLSEKEAQTILEKRSFSQAVSSDWRRAVEMEIRAVPTFLFNGQSLPGAQKYEILDRLMVTHNVARR